LAFCTISARRLKLSRCICVLRHRRRLGLIIQLRAPGLRRRSFHVRGTTARLWCCGSSCGVAGRGAEGGAKLHPSIAELDTGFLLRKAKKARISWLFFKKEHLSSFVFVIDSARLRI
jgi:hypothetical protein